MASHKNKNNTVIGGADPSLPQMNTGSAQSFHQNLAIRTEDPSVAFAASLGISPAVVTNPPARKPSATVRNFVGDLSRKVTKAQDLAVASLVAENSKESKYLAAACAMKLDDDLRTVHANNVQAIQDTKDIEGWVRWVRKEHEKDIRELQIMVRALTTILAAHFSDAERAELSEAEADVKAMRDEVDREYMDTVGPRGEGQPDDEGSDFE